MPQANGTFEVQLAPQPHSAGEQAVLGRMSIDKRFTGDLDASSVGEMLSAMADQGSAVYVAIEQVNGTLHGRSGSFVLVHNGLMTATAQQLTISVMPGSGTGELAGLAGSMSIANVEGAHSYALDYTLPA